MHNWDVKRRLKSYLRYLAGHKALWPLMIIIIALLTFSLLQLTRSTPDIRPALEKAWAVSVQTLEPGTHIPMVTLYGKVESPRTSELRSALTAGVRATPALEGRLVQRGELLVKLDPRDIQFLLRQSQANVAELKAQIAAEKIRAKTDLLTLKQEESLVALAQKKVDRRKQLLEKQAGAAQTLDDATEVLHQRQLSLVRRQLEVEDHANRLARLEAQLANAEAVNEFHELELKRTEIRAPFTGKITDVYVSVGERVDKGHRLVQLFDFKRAEVRALIPEQYLGSIRKAIASKTPVIATAEVDGVKLNLVLDRLAAEIELGRTGIEGLFSIQDAGQHAILGRALVMQLHLPPEKDSYAIPVTAMFGADRVYTVVDSRLESHKVHRIGYTFQGDDILLLVRSADLKAGDKLLVTQIPNAVNGLRVKING